MKLERKTIFQIALAVFLLYLCIHYWPAVSGFLGTLLGAAAPLLIGGVIAYVVNILMAFYERHWFPKTEKRWLIGARRPLALIFALLTVIAIVVGVVWLVLPQLISGVGLLISQLPGAITKLIAWLDQMEFMPRDFIATLESIDWKSRIGQLFDVLYSGVGNVMNVVVSTVSSVFSGVVTALLAFIFAIYLLLSKQTLCRQCKRVMHRYLPEKATGKITYFVGVLNDCFHGYIVGQCTEALILGVLCFIGMWILRLPYAPMIAALVAFTALIPVAGAYIGAGVGAFMILMDSPIKALIFLIFIVVLQQLEGNLIYPRVVGNSIGLPALWVLAAVTVGGGVMGVGGMLLAVPLTATLWQILKNDLNKTEA